MEFKISKIKINNFRSISKLSLDLNEETLSVICGANNVGKTNFLRALNLFFHCHVDLFNPELDISYHVQKGSHGAGYKSTIELTFSNGTDTNYIIKQVYSTKKENKVLQLTGKKNGTAIDEKAIVKFLNKFRFIFIEASNVNLPKLIAEIVNEDILPLGLDRRRGAAQQESLTKLDEFIDASKHVVSTIETQITKTFNELLKEIDSIDSDNWKLRIIFPEYSYLREAITNMVRFTLFDTNDHELETKGSGIQRIILLSLIKYINKKSKKDLVWGIDEPEVFLQPGLQKQLFSEFKKTSEKSQIFLTTHSHFFVDLNNMQSVHLFTSTKEIKEYARRPGQQYFKVNTEKFEGTQFEKIQQIRNHLGISKNDSWEIMPFNIVVEGEEDKVYLTKIMELLNIQVPNFIPAGGVTKYKGLIMYINYYCHELDFKPKVVCLFDRDSEARSVYTSMEKKLTKYSKNIELKLRYINSSEGSESNDLEIEDFVYPELIYSAANKILRKSSYLSIRKGEQAKRELPAYAHLPILKFISEMSKQRNEDKYQKDFEKYSNKLKLIEHFKKEVAKITDMTEFKTSHPKVEEFLIDLVKDASL